MFGPDAANLRVNSIESVRASTATGDVVRMLAAGTLSTSNVETVIGSSAADVVRLQASGDIAVSVVETVVGNSGTDVVTMLRSGIDVGTIALSNVESVVGSTLAGRHRQSARQRRPRRVADRIRHRWHRC